MLMVIFDYHVQLCFTRTRLDLVKSFFFYFQRKSAQYLVNLVEYEDIRDEELNLVSLSQYMLGDMFYTGIALEKDDAKALK